MNQLEDLINKHKDLDALLETSENKLPFISDWNCKHPFYKEQFKLPKTDEDQFGKYSYIREDKDLLRLISDYHYTHNEPKYALNEILMSHGSTSIISAFFIWLATENIKEIYYIPPIYHTIPFFSKTQNIALRPITKSHLYESNVQLNLPEKRTILIITDPIWFTGFSVQEKFLMEIKAWQEKTQSLIFIDGSFQYLKWDCSKYEFSSVLNKDLTFRLICPSKSIAMHGFRFSYLLLPQKHYDTFDFILNNLMGSSNFCDMAFAKKCMLILVSEESNTRLIKYIENIYLKLRDNNLITTTLEPSCGYFIFAKIKKSKGKFYSMDGRYFEQEKYKDYVRINLLNPILDELF